MQIQQSIFSGIKARITQGLVLLLCIQPAFILVIKGWSSGILIVGGLASFVVLCSPRHRQLAQEDTSSEPMSRWFFWAFASWIITTILAGLFRGYLDIGLLDSPSRFLLAIPVFYFVQRSRTDFLRILVIAVALSSPATLLHQVFSSHANDWSSSRMSNYFADPLAFGYICLSLAFMSAASLYFQPKSNLCASMLKVLGVITGLYLSFRTESRTGWLAFPLVLLCLLYFHTGRVHLRNVALGLIVMACAVWIGYGVSPIMKDRIDITRSDIDSYTFKGVAADTSIGLRITFLRMAIDMLSEHPLAGYGDTQKVHPAVPEKVGRYASPFAQNFAVSAGFHNEIITNGVQSGILAMLSISAIFCVPMVIYARALKSREQVRRVSGLLGLVFTLTILVSSFSTEVFGLKYTASYFALLTALLCGICLKSVQEKPL